MQAFVERVESALADLKQGKMIILTDDPDRENEGDLICAAEMITPEMMNFIVRNTCGIVCLSLAEEKLKKLDLPLMVSTNANTSSRGTPFTISIDAKSGITTGVSAQDRVRTIQAAIKEDVCPEDVVKPGHIFPLQAKPGGVLERAGHTEGAVDLMRLAGLQPAAVLCEVMNPDGTMAKGKELEDFAERHTIKLLSIEEIISYRLLQENLIAEEASVKLPLQKYGLFDMTVIKEKITGNEHFVLTKENTESSQPILVRVHSSCATGDILGSLRCDCNLQLHHALERMSQEGGILIYLNQEGRGIGLFNKIKAYALQDKGFDTVEANQVLGLPVDARKYHIAANILRNRKIKSIRLLTNNMDKANELKKCGIEDIKVESTPVFCNSHNENYLHTKKDKLNHLINF